jgi:hypothetical protein
MTTCLGPFDTLRKRVETQESSAHITQAQQQAEQLFEASLTKIEQAAAKPEP